MIQLFSLFLLLFLSLLNAYVFPSMEALIETTPPLMYAQKKRKHSAVQNADGRECNIMLRRVYGTETQERKQCTFRARSRTWYS
jgi:hypothetical protein